MVARVSCWRLVGLGVQDSRLEVLGLRLCVWDWGSWGMRLRVWALAFGALGLGLWGHGLGLTGCGLGVQVLD